MKDVEYDSNTGELLEPRAARGDVMEYGGHMRHFYDAFKQLQEKLPVEIEHDKDGQRAKYLTYAGMMKVIRPLALECGFTIIHGQTRSWNSEDKVRLYVIYTDLVHVTSGMFRRSQIEMPIPKLDPQAVGSALTYGKRYTLLALLGLATSDDPTDDDGEAAQRNQVSGDIAESDTLVELKAEIDKLGNEATAYVSWPKDKKVDQRIQQLSQSEAGVLRAYYAAARKQAIES